MHTYMCVSEGKTCSFFGKFGMLCFLETLILRFVLLSYYWQNLNYRVEVEYQDRTSPSFFAVLQRFYEVCKVFIKSKLLNCSFLLQNKLFTEDGWPISGRCFHSVHSENRKIVDFVMFSGSLEREHWPEMG